MGYRQKRLAELHRGVEASLAALDLGVETPAHDGWLDPDGLAAALAASEPVLFRAHPPLGPADAGYAPAPVDPVWVSVTDKSARTSPLRAPSPGPLEAEAVRVIVEPEPWPEDARGQPKQVATVVCGDLVIAEAVGDDPDAARAVIAPLARALAGRLGLALEDDFPERPVDPQLPLSAGALARLSLRREGSRFVLRDYASHGPQEAASGEAIATALLGLGAAVSSYLAYAAYREAAWERLAITGSIAFVLTLATYAWFHIARHSARYRAKSEALFVVGHDRFVVAPWHARSGAVDENPEGRYGAALALSELDQITVVAEGGATLRLETSHGPMDVGTLESDEQARTWKDALGRIATAVRQPARKKKPLGAAALALLGLSACGPAPEPLVVSPPPPPPPVAASTIAAPPPVPAPAPPPAPKLALIEDDLPRAQALARESDRPLFVEVWAPWCHTCLSMKSFVLPDPAIVAFSERVVFSAIDSDRPENAAFLDAHEVNVWPTLFVLDPAGEVLGLWQGAASVRELRELLQSSLDAREVGRDPEGPVAALLEAKRAHAKGVWLSAASHYQRALDRGGADWPRRSEALAGLLFSEYRQKHWERCATLGAQHAAEIAGAAVPTDFCWAALACAKEVRAKPVGESARSACKARLEQHTESPPPEASVDDRSDALSLYADLLRAAGDRQGARRAVESQLALLEGAASEAPSPEAAATFDYARLNAYLTLGRGDEAVRMLEKRIQELPEGYEPHARLAQALMAVGRHGDAVAPLDRAIELSYGPRRLGYLDSKAKLSRRLGDRAGEKAALEAIVSGYEELEEALRKRHKDTYESARQRLNQL